MEGIEEGFRLWVGFGGPQKRDTPTTLELQLGTEVWNFRNTPSVPSAPFECSSHFLESLVFVIGLRLGASGLGSRVLF